MEVASSSTTLAIPGYRILKKINQGGMSTVYLAVQRSVGRQVALKVMSPALNADPIFSERFQREANIVGQLSHPNIIGIHDIGCYRRLNYIAMDYLAGGSVADRLAKSAMDPLEALNITREIALALDHAHGKGYVHRDLKPENILFREDGSAVLTDFGVARTVAGTSRMTTTGMVVGTPHYMSPEQARGAAIDGRADLYSLGVVLYEMITSVVPFQAEEAVAIAIKHLTDPVPKLPARHSLYQPMLDRFLAKDPDNRFQRGLEAVDTIDQLLATLAGKPAVQSMQQDSNPVGTSSLIRALLITLYGTLSNQLSSAWRRWWDKPLQENPERAEQTTVIRVRQVLQQVPRQPRRRWISGAVALAVILVCWLGLSLHSRVFAWRFDYGPLESARQLTATLLLPGEAHPVAPIPQAAPPEPAAVPATEDLTGEILQGDAHEARQAQQTPTPADVVLAPQENEAPPMDTAGVAVPPADPSADGPADEAEVAAPTPEPPRYSLSVKTSPGNARVRIMNIAPRYEPGMALPPGPYDLEISRPGYVTERRWITIEDSDLSVAVTLARAFVPGSRFRSPLSGGGRGPEMVVVGSGRFTMGNNKRAVAKPERRVRIGRAFAISSHEITFDDYDLFAKEAGAALPGDAGWGRKSRPVINVAWRDAVDYTRWLSRKTGKRYRLPSEAEWEYAARGGSSSPFWWGKGKANGKANCRRGCASQFTGLFTATSSPVGHYPANPFGLYDTAGNVAEWVQDCFVANHSRGRSDGRPVAIENCSQRTLRGGSMRDPVANTSSDYRKGLDQSTLSREVGFRVVMELP
ncbi:SUMF1/EgtB/PvdO family nonheme iron enzyme [Microbulbifer sp. TYP-18]|uniref:bifunctional serine/threonine-protein kinase/formylglycine-generating enzyme family protein n=1 Tax=Microbulbifer sp. TYP-18 TaxID=3230024 RepID=UPI0034C5F5E8